MTSEETTHASSVSKLQDKGEVCDHLGSFQNECHRQQCTALTLFDSGPRMLKERTDITDLANGAELCHSMQTCGLACKHARSRLSSEPIPRGRPCCMQARLQSGQSIPLHAMTSTLVRSTRFRQAMQSRLFMQCAVPQTLNAKLPSLEHTPAATQPPLSPFKTERLQLRCLAQM